MKNEITTGHLMEEGHSGLPLTWDGKSARWGDAIIPMIFGGLEEPPPGVSEVRLLVPFYKNDDWMDGALITGSPQPQRFTGTRQFVEQPISGKGIGLGIMPDGSSIMYIPDSTYSVRTRKREGSISYSGGWTWCWVKMGKHKFQYVELCLPLYQKDNTIKVLPDNSPVEAPLFWGLLRMLRNEAGR